MLYYKMNKTNADEYVEKVRKGNRERQKKFYEANKEKVNALRRAKYAIKKDPTLKLEVLIKQKPKTVKQVKPVEPEEQARQPEPVEEVVPVTVTKSQQAKQPEPVITVLSYDNIVKN